MPESRGHEGKPRDGARPAASPPSDALREQQAIAAAMIIGEEMRQSDRALMYVLTYRIAAFVGIMSVIGLVILFGFARIAGESFNPFPYMIGLGILAAGSAVAAYWGYAESRRGPDR